MPVRKALVAAAFVGVLVGCSSVDPNAHVDIAKVFDVKSTFGPQFKVVTAGPSGIDPKRLSAQTLPRGTTFDPPDCARYAAGETLPPDLRGNLAGVTAEGEGNRFIAIAVETSKRVPFDRAITQKCKHVTFNGGTVKGAVDIVDAPHIDGAQTIGTHRVLEAKVAGAARSGELYNYVSYLGQYIVMVTANPLIVPNQPVAPVNVQRARQLLTDAVNAVRR